MTNLCWIVKPKFNQLYPNIDEVENKGKKVRFYRYECSTIFYN